MFNRVNNSTNNQLPSNSFAVSSNVEAVDKEQADKTNHTQVSLAEAQVDRQALSDAQKLLAPTFLVRNSRRDQFFPVTGKLKEAYQAMNPTSASPPSAP